MIKPIIVFTVICDRCGADSNRDAEHVGWTTEDAALDLAGESGWSINETIHLCADCIVLVCENLFGFADSTHFEDEDEDEGDYCSKYTHGQCVCDEETGCQFDKEEQK